jgi:hemoglobin
VFFDKFINSIYIYAKYILFNNNLTSGMKRQIKEREDIEFLVDEFYRKVKKDKIIGHIFNDVVNFSWDIHIPIMISFWETILLDKATYKGNVMLQHIELNKKYPLTADHFEQWKKLFFETLDEFFEGEKANEAKKRVEAMASLMRYKIEQSTNPNFVQ